LALSLGVGEDFKKYMPVGELRQELKTKKKKRIIWSNSKKNPDENFSGRVANGFCLYGPPLNQRMFLRV
jgi:hypothetical protein